MLHAVAKHYAHLADIQNVLEKKRKEKMVKWYFIFQTPLKNFLVVEY